MTGRLKITRGIAWRDSLRTYTIFSNDRQITKIRMRETVEVELPPGQYSLEARIDFCRSKVLRVGVVDGSTVKVDVRPGSLLGFIPIPGYVKLVLS